mmetsp:Transcript_55846/g.167377  ORF Transcript_55846/g.167377 Transcript_55846/m.167377 type:complete len:111 (-) Transcript_55846:171-503(-)
MEMNTDTFNVYIHDCHGGENQKWYWYSSKEEIRNQVNGRCLDYNYSNGNLYVHNCHGGSNQKWTWDGNRFKSLHDGKCIDMNLNWSKNLILYSCHDGLNQKFIVPDKFFW